MAMRTEALLVAHWPCVENSIVTMLDVASNDSVALPGQQHEAGSQVEESIWKV